MLVTHHHLDHSGLAATIAARSGARIAAYERAAAYGAHYEERGEADRRFSLALMRHHGVPETVIADTEAFWEFMRRQSRPLHRGHRAGRRRAHPRRRPRPARRRAPRAQHHRRAARRRARADRVRRRPPARQDLLQHRGLPGAGARRARARARASSTWRACGGRPRCRSPRLLHRARRRHHRSRRARRRSGWPTTSAAATGSSRRSRPARATAYEIAARPVARDDGPRAAAARRLGGPRAPRPAAGRRTRPAST